MRKLILETAMQLFLEEGFGNISIRRIADKIEYSPATIYLYFKDKDEILYALHTEGFEELFRCQQSITTTVDPRERLRRHGEAYIRFGLEHPEYYNLMFITRGPGKKIHEGDDWTVGRRSYEFFLQDVQASIDAGIIREADPMVAAFALWSVAHGIVSLILRNRCPMIDQRELHAMALRAFDVLVQNLGPADTAVVSNISERKK
ncbi:MAG TPA: TetR/AcrR family transcriptional regulator [Bacteroidota bacterium]|nr:TetR/AcrR family transcriptional regulator [Bacteroidota bacterium]